MWREHHLSEEHDKIICPLNRKYLCNGHCAWFDHESQDCRMVQKQKPGPEFMELRDID